MPTSLEQLRSQYPNLSDDQIADLAALSLKVGGNKDTRSGFLGLVKKAEPNLPIPEVDTAAAFEAELAKRDKKIEQMEKAQQDRDFNAALASQKAEARTKHGLSDDDMTRMEEMMKKGELPADYRFAPALYKQQTESTVPTNYGSSGYGPFDLNRAAQEKGFEGLMDDPDNWAVRTAHQMIDDARAKGRAPSF